ncbi:MAG: MurR/RpiR family transcriptional regulator [Clostridiales bacterium]|nr:MurR/RpiR family transcriptional regulator [Clostridiales bacterium]
MDKDVVSLIESRMREFSKGQIRIAKYIQENYDKAAFMTAARLGEVTNVSESTVVRFASELGYEGFPEMRRALQEMIRSRLTSVQRIEVAKSVIGTKDTLQAIIHSDMDKMRMTLDAVDRDSFNEAVARILCARRIYIVGTRTAAALSMFMGYYFNLLFDNVKVLGDSMSAEIFEQMLRISSEDVLIGISFPRYSKRSVRTVRYARDIGASIICITDAPTSPLAPLADVCLYAKSDMVSFLDSLVAPLSLINALIVAVGTETNEKLSATFSDLERVWTEYEVYEKFDN